MDVDICGPSIPKIMGLEGEQIHQSGMGWSPVYVRENLAVMSVGFLLNDPDEAIIWRGAKKNGNGFSWYPDSYNSSRIDKAIFAGCVLGRARLFSDRYTARDI